MTTPAPEDAAPLSQAAPAGPLEGELIDLEEGEPQPLPAEVKRKRQYARMENFTADQIHVFLTQLEELGVIYKAADIAGLSYQTVKRLRREDDVFKDLTEEAHQVYREGLEREAHRRAVTGWLEPVFSQKTGDKIGVIRRFDSKLLELMLKRHIPEYREKFEGEIKVTGGVLIAPVAPQTPEDWVAKHAGTELKMLSEAPAAPPAE